jgi:putative spermidine/putrescine transport system ATP-binding protein
LINEPKVLLLDEPLGALDLKLREQMQSELKALQRKLGITFLFITHDQHEALSMSDRVGVFNQGKLEQVATPYDLYNTPKTRFVANFIGAANVIEGQFSIDMTKHPAMMLRPEQVRLCSFDVARLRGLVTEVQYFGSFSRVHVQTPLAMLMADVPSQSASYLPSIGSSTGLTWVREAAHPLR